VAGNDAAVQEIAKTLSRRDEVLAHANNPNLSPAERARYVEMAKYFDDFAKLEVKTMRAKKGLERGGGLFVLGALLTGIGYFAADPGGSFRVWVGAIGFGAVYLIIGIFRYVTVQRDWGNLSARYPLAEWTREMKAEAASARNTKRERGSAEEKGPRPAGQYDPSEY
jgi:hypothetical protein